MILIWREADENLGQRYEGWERLYVGEDKAKAAEVYQEYLAEGRKLMVARETNPGDIL